jgi:hypothetical protein
MGIAATGFCYPGGILQAFIDKISKFFIDKIRKLFIDKINKFCGSSSSQITSTDPGGIRHGHYQQDLHQQLDCAGTSDSSTLVNYRQLAARAA